ncbi:hypothetical protein C2G38_2236075 [Gigaspora rosea]|uniref:Uncharacterized protein n=1 Tax=Gigaspora rosea TaxID=44941 RepID=A0A397TYU3_9GLOM|nr:hypothetical protein C2G38_2236075 [Gigaspora rosea]
MSHAVERNSLIGYINKTYNLGHRNGTRVEENGIEVETDKHKALDYHQKPAESEKPTGSYRNLEAACVAWKTKIELFKAQVNKFEPEKRLKKEVSVSENPDDASRMWMLKVKDISNMKLVEKWKKRIKKDNVVNEVIKRPEEEKWINGYKTAKPTRSKEKEKKYIPNGFGVIRSDHVIYEFGTQRITSVERSIILLIERPFVHNNLVVAWLGDLDLQTGDQVSNREIESPNGRSSLQTTD